MLLQNIPHNGNKNRENRGKSTRKGVREKGPSVLLACRDDIITSTQAQELRVGGNINKKKRTERDERWLRE